jgi:hypothetical protein
MLVEVQAAQALPTCRQLQAAKGTCMDAVVDHVVSSEVCAGPCHNSTAA